MKTNHGTKGTKATHSGYYPKAGSKEGAKASEHKEAPSSFKIGSREGNPGSGGGNAPMKGSGGHGGGGSIDHIKSHHLPGPKHPAGKKWEYE